MASWDEQETERRRLKLQQEIELERMRSDPARIAATAAADKVRAEGETALIEARGRNVDTELALIAEQNRPALAREETNRALHTNLVKLGALAIFGGFWLLLGWMAFT